jgi:glyoxylase-like metal-dependent hydrolase (beta-lactamase superfamily II)
MYRSHREFLQGEHMQLAPNLHRIGNDIIAVYLVIADDGVTVIDAGLTGHYRELEKELATIGRSLDDVRGLILTHGDSDHIGFAERLRREHNVPVFVHERDAGRARGEAKPATGKEKMKLAATLGFAAYALRKGGLINHYLTEVVTVVDGQSLDLPGKPKVIGMPGHSPGSIAIHVPSVDAVFVGDALTTRNVLTGAVGPAAAPFTDDPEQARASLTALLPTKATWVLPGHGVPYNGGVAAAVGAISA